MCWMSGNDNPESKIATANAGSANQLSQNAIGASADSRAKANQLYSTLAPTLTAEATNPMGFAPGDLDASNTASQQSLGGSTAGIVGQGALQGARTRNAAAPQASIAEGGREAMRRNSQNAVEIQGQNAIQREKNRQAGISGLSGLYGGLSDADFKGLGIANSALGTSNDALGVITGARNTRSPWDTIAINTANNLTKKSSSAGGG